MSRKKGLGRSLEDLIPNSTEWILRDDLKIFFCPVDRLEPNPFQPRITIEDDEALEELVQSIRGKGILQPLLVMKGDGENKYCIIAGERRWRAAQKAGLTEVPVIVKEASSVEAVELALIENIQRKDLTSIEEALAYTKLQEEFGLTQEEIAKRVGKSRSAVANTIRLLSLSEDIQKDIIEGRLSMGHARALLSLPTEELRRFLRNEIISDNLTVRDAEHKAHVLSEQTVLSRPQGKSQSYEAISPFSQQEKLLSSALNAEVRIRKLRKKAQIVIDVENEEELNRLVSFLSSVHMTL